MRQFELGCCLQQRKFAYPARRSKSLLFRRRGWVYSSSMKFRQPEKALQEECFFHFRVWRPVHSPNPLARHHICKFARFFRRKGFAYLAAQRSRYCGSAEIYEKGQYIKWAMQYALPRAPHSRTLPPWRPRRARQIPVLAPRTAFRTCPALGIILAHSPRISSPMKFL